MEERAERFNFKPIRNSNVLKKLNKLPDKSKLDLLNFDCKLMRIAACQIAPHITSLFNLSIREGKLPAFWKRAKVTPIYKGKGKIEECINYRPISTLPYIAKIIESCVQEQLVDYLNINNMLCCEQSAYLKKHSTTTSLHRVVDNWLTNINNNFINGVAFFDLSKCFDTINHKRLLKKLKLYGIRDVALSWFTDYLDSRSQAVTANGILSSFLEILIGVPQGSNLGPLLFLLFVNYFPKCLECSQCDLFADDTAIYCKGTDMQSVNVTL